MLSEVGGKAVEAEEQVKVLRQRIGEMEEQMKKTEEVYKEQVRSSFKALSILTKAPPVSTMFFHFFSDKRSRKQNSFELGTLTCRPRPRLKV